MQPENGITFDRSNAVAMSVFIVFSYFSSTDPDYGLVVTSRGLHQHFEDEQVRVPVAVVPNKRQGRKGIIGGILKSFWWALIVSQMA